MTELEDDARIAERGDDGVGFLLGARQALLAVHVDATLGGGGGDARVPVIGGGADDQVDVA